MNKIISKSQLEIQIGLTCLQLLGNHLERYLWIEIGKHLFKLIVRKQTVEYLWEIFRLPRTDGIKFLRDIHNFMFYGKLEK